MQDLTGRVVSEEEVAADLGFASVAEMWRWETEMGRKVSDIEARLGEVERDRDSFRWHGRRMRVVLERILGSLLRCEPLHPDTKLAIGVVIGTDVDWDRRLSGWFDEVGGTTDGQS